MLIIFCILPLQTWHFWCDNKHLRKVCAPKCYSSENVLERKNLWETKLLAKSWYHKLMECSLPMTSNSNNIARALKRLTWPTKQRELLIPIPSSCQRRVIKTKDFSNPRYKFGHWLTAWLSRFNSKFIIISLKIKSGIKTNMCVRLWHRSPKAVSWEFSSLLEWQQVCNRKLTLYLAFHLQQLIRLTQIKPKMFESKTNKN